MREHAIRQGLAAFLIALSFADSVAAQDDLSCRNFLQAEPEQLVSRIKWGGDTSSPPTPGCTGNEMESCEWSNAVILERTSGDQRLVIVNSNHETGSGAWDYVTVYGCRNGQVTALFGRRYLYGADVRIFAHGKLSLQSGYWRKNDPACCASREKIETYKWNAEAGRYERSGSVLRVNRER